MIQAFRKHIETHFPRMVHGKVLLAVSGGLDSVVLAHLCHECKLELGIAHCNFQLRGAESDADEEFVQLLSKTLLRPVYLKKFDTLSYMADNKLALQQAARELRYQWFEEIRKQYRYDVICTAHHSDDAIETFLIHMLRGTGIDGLTGIPSVNGFVCRPLLPFSRKQLHAYAVKHKLSWREDSSNAGDAYLRNRIRHHLMPVLMEFQPDLHKSFQLTFQNLKGSAALIENHTREIKSAIFIKSDDRYRIPIRVLEGLEPRSAYLYAFFKEYGFTQWPDLDRLLKGASGKVLYSSSHRLFKDREYLQLEPLISRKGEPQEVYIRKHSTRVLRPISLIFEEVNEAGQNTPSEIYVDTSMLKYPLKLRRWQEGDKFIPFGMTGQKKLSKFFKDEKYNLRQKEDQWLLCDATNTVVWVVGKRADNRFRVKPESTKITKIVYLGDS